MRFSSSNWVWVAEQGSLFCEKHRLYVDDGSGCPSCAEEHSPDMTCRFDEMDIDILAFEKIPATDLLPSDCVWMVEAGQVHG